MSTEDKAISEYYNSIHNELVKFFQKKTTISGNPYDNADEAISYLPEVINNWSDDKKGKLTFTIFIRNACIRKLIDQYRYLNKEHINTRTEKSISYQQTINIDELTNYLRYNDRSFQNIDWQNLKEVLVNEAQKHLPYDYYLILKDYVIPKCDNASHKRLKEIVDRLTVSSTTIETKLKDGTLQNFIREYIS